MKKFLVLALASLCAASAAAFSACSFINSYQEASGGGEELDEISESGEELDEISESGEESDETDSELTKSEWEKAFAESNFHNVTAKVTGVGTSGDVESYNVRYYLETDSYGYITGVIYVSYTYDTDESDVGYELVERYYMVEYSEEDSGYYSYKATDQDDGTFSYSSGKVSTGYYLYNVDPMGVYLPYLADYYSDFTYSDGSYTGTVNKSTITVTVSDGKVVKVTGIVVDSFTLTYELSDYGTTKVEVPSGISYTYEQAAAVEYISTIKILNTILAIEECIDTIATVEDAQQVLEENGFSVTEIASSYIYTMYWDSQTNRILLWSDKTSTVIYSDSSADYDGVTEVQSTWYILTDEN